jgi:hypothetical protein
MRFSFCVPASNPWLTSCVRDNKNVARADFLHRREVIDRVHYLLFTLPITPSFYSNAMRATLLLATPALALPSFFSSNAQQAPIHAEEHSQGYKFDPLLHLPGTSPYFDAVGFGLKHKAPPGCNITAASYIVRHGA